MTIFQDIKTAIKMTGEIRKARENGASAVQVRPVYRVPFVDFGPGYIHTMEGHLTRNSGREVHRAVNEVFERLPRDVQHQLVEFTPEGPGGWVERAKFWQKQLGPALPLAMYHDVMLTFIHHYACCMRMRKEARA